MSYIKIEFGGKERGFKFNQLAKEILELKGNQILNTKNVYALFYAGLRGCSEVKEEEPDYSYEDVCGWVDDIYLKPDAADIIKTVADVFYSTQIYQNLIAQKPAEEEKKRLPKKSG